MHPFRCKKCQKLHYSTSSTRIPAECCPDSKLERLARICLMIPCPSDQKPLLVSQELAGVCEGGRKWVVACGAKTVPVFHTTEPVAATCKKCLEYADKHLSAFGWDEPAPEEPEPFPETSEDIEFSGFDELPNPFKEEKG